MAIFSAGAYPVNKGPISSGRPASSACDTLSALHDVGSVVADDRHAVTDDTDLLAAAMPDKYLAGSAYAMMQHISTYAR